MDLYITDKELQTVAKPVNFDVPYRNLKLAEDLFKTMEQLGGIGLAATQVGLTERVFVMLTYNRVRFCFNPRITECWDQKITVTEGCLSFPGQQCSVERTLSIRVEYFNYNGEIRNEVLTGLEAICFQHELDHLNGITMLDRARSENDTVQS